MHGRGPDSADCSQATYAGPNIPDRDIRLDLLGPAAFGSGPSRRKESDADLSGVERVDGGGYCKPNRDGPGSTKYRNRKVVLFMAMPHPMLPLGYRTAPALRVSGVRFDGSPKSSYNEYICYTIMPS